MVELPIYRILTITFNIVKLPIYRILTITFNMVKLPIYRILTITFNMVKLPIYRLLPITFNMVELPISHLNNQFEYTKISIIVAYKILEGVTSVNLNITVLTNILRLRSLAVNLYGNKKPLFTQTQALHILSGTLCLYLYMLIQKKLKLKQKQVSICIAERCILMWILNNHMAR